MNDWADKRLQAGTRFWLAKRSDGTEVSFHADKATIEDGCLCLWMTSMYEGVDKPRVPFTQPELVYSIAAGGWSCFWRASAADARAIAVDADTGDVDGCNCLRDYEVYGR